MKKTEIRQRKGRVVTTTTTTTRTTTGRSRGSDPDSDGHASDVDSPMSGVSKTSLIVGLVLMLLVGFQYSSLMETLHDNQLWFSNIKEVEREISFRTESGLYFSYYKTFIEAPSTVQGFRELIYDNVTEHGRTINILERFNIYQEVFLGLVYRFLPFNVQPVYLYIRSVFALHGMLLCCLYLLTWCMTGSWFAGALTACLYVANKDDTTRTMYIIPLRESFSLPFLWAQILCMHLYMSNQVKNKQLQKLLIAGIALFTINFTLTWQFAQFVLLLQAAALYAVWVLDYIPPEKIRNIFFCQLGAMAACFVLQFGNKMVFGSLLMGLVPAVFLAMLIKRRSDHGSGVFMGLLKAAFYTIAVAVVTLVINKAVKVAINLDADEHIFKFVLTKFGIGNPKDFDTLLYMCNGAFEFMGTDIYRRMSVGVAFPMYALVHVGLLVLFIQATFENWGKVTEQNNNEENEDTKKIQGPSTAQSLFQKRPELAYHTVQVVLFGVMGIMVMRMKFLWTPYMCILCTLLVADQQLWSYFMSKLSKATGKGAASIGSKARHIATAITMALLLATWLPGLMKELDNLREFHDPDTVQLMEWIKSSTSPTASFTGSMQLLAGVKLCTKRPLLNHPHYEDKELRKRTKDLYIMYAKATPEEVYETMKAYDVHYIILEDSICLSPKDKGCRLPDIMDYDNGVLPTGFPPEPGLKKSTKPQFCNIVRHGSFPYNKYFKSVFTNKTFRIYQVL